MRDYLFPLLFGLVLMWILVLGLCGCRLVGPRATVCKPVICKCEFPVPPPSCSKVGELTLPTPGHDHRKLPDIRPGFHLAEPGDIHFCDKCEKWWRYEDPMLSCAVMHLDSDCCHYSQTEVDSSTEVKAPDVDSDG